MTLRCVLLGFEDEVKLLQQIEDVESFLQGDLVTDVEIDSLTSDAFILRSSNTSDRVLIVCAGRTAIS